MEFSLDEIFSEIDKQAKAFGVNPKNAKALLIAENTPDGSIKNRKSFRSDAVSPVGARGLMQVMPDTAKGLQQAGYLPADWKYDPTDLKSNIAAGLAAMKEKMGRMNNPDDLDELASVYNGSTRTHKAFKAGRLNELPAETKQYQQKLGRASMELDGTRGNNPSAFVATPSSSTPTTRSTSSGTTSVSTKRYTDPMQFDNFMNEVANMTGPNGAFDVTSQLVQQEQDARELMDPRIIQAVAAKGAAAGAEASAVATSTAANAARRAQILRKVNMHPDQVNGELDRAMQIIDSTDAELRMMKPEIDARMNVGFFDNPLEWLINQVRLPGMVETYNTTASTQNAAQDRFKEVAALANTQQSLSQNIDADLILQAGAATSKRIAADAALDAMKFERETSGDRSRTAMQVMQLAGQRIGMQSSALEKTKETVREAAGETERQKTARMEEEQLRSINQVLVAAGGNPIPSLKGLPAAKIEMLKSAATSGKFGKNFSESFDFVWNDGNLDKVAAGGGAAIAYWTKGTLAETGSGVQQQALQAEKLKQKFDGKKAIAAGLDGMQQAYETQAATDMRLAGKYNPFKLNYESLAKDPLLANNQVAMWINKFGPKGAEPVMGAIDEQILVNKFASAVAAGRITAPQAAKEIATFYQITTAKQAELTKYNLFGLSKPEKTYAVKLQAMNNKTLDLGDPTEVENAITRKVAQDRVVQLGVKASRGGASMANPLFVFGD